MGTPPRAPPISRGTSISGSGLGREESNPGGIGGSAPGQGGEPQREKFPTVSAATYGGPEGRKVREFDEATRQGVGEACLSYVRGVMIGSGTEANLSEIDMRFVALVKKMAGKNEDLNYNIVAELQHSDLSLERLEPSEWALLNDTLFALEKALGMTVGAEATPTDEWLKKKNFVARLIARGKAIAEGRVMDARETGYALVAAIDEEAISLQRTKDDWKKVRGYLKENFRDLPYQCIKEGLDSAGLKGFVLGKDLQGRSLREQTNDLVRLMQARRRLYWHLTGGGGRFKSSKEAVNSPDFDRYTVGVADVLQQLMTKPAFEYTPEERAKLEIEASLRATKKIATELCREATVSWVRTGGGTQALKDFYDELDKLGGAETEEQKAKRSELETKVNDAKRQYEEAQNVSSQTESRITGYTSRLQILDAEIEKLGQEIDDLTKIWNAQVVAKQVPDRQIGDAIKEKGRIREGCQKERGTILSEKQPADSGKISELKTDEANAKVALGKAEAELKKLGVVRTAQTEEVRQQAEALRKIVGTWEETVTTLGSETIKKTKEGRMHDILANIAAGTIPLDQLTDDPARWQDNMSAIRTWIGLKDSVFDEAMGPNNAYFQVFLIKALGIPIPGVDPKDLLRVAKLKKPSKAPDKELLEKVHSGILKAIRDNEYPGLVRLAYQSWDALRTSFVAYGVEGGMRIDYGTFSSVAEVVGPVKAKVAESPLSAAVKRQDFYPGINTAVQYLTLADGTKLALVVGPDGKNIVIDAKGRSLGTLERAQTVGGMVVIEGTTTPELRRQQDEIFTALVFETIRSKIESGATPYLGLALKKKGEIYTVEKKPWQEYFDEHSDRLREIVLESIKDLEEKSNELRQQREAAREFTPRYSKYQGEFRWYGSDANRTDPNYREFLVQFTNEGIKLQLMEVKPLAPGLPWLPYTIDNKDGDPFLIDAGDVDIAAAGSTLGPDEIKNLRKSLLERGFYALTLEERPGQILNTHIDLGGGKVYDFGIGENGRLVRWDQSGKEEMALEALNRDCRLGVLADHELKKIRQKLGTTYLNRRYERWKEAWKGYSF